MRRVVFVSAVLLALPALATPRKDIVDAWTQLNAATIEMTSPGVAGSTKYEFEITPEADTRIHVTSTQNGLSTKGTLMLVSGVLLAKDVPLPAGNELDVIDACGITLQLVNKLLAYGANSLPLSIRGRREVEMVETLDTLDVKTSTAAASLPPPWKLSGSVESLKTGHVTYDLTHAAGDEAPPVRFVGTWEKRKPPPALPDATSIVGWKVYRIGAQDGEYGVTASAQKYPTLGALRAALKPAPPKE
jgi:hypothetical protein